MCRYESVRPTAKKFLAFRAEIQRGELVDSSGCKHSVKGFVWVARWATQDTPHVRTRLLIEDPATRGDPRAPIDSPGHRGLLEEFGNVIVTSKSTAISQLS